MGRGSRNQASGAQSLLYGTRQRGSGPKEINLPPQPTQFPDLVKSLATALGDSGLIFSDDAAKLPEHLNRNSRWQLLRQDRDGESHLVLYQNGPLNRLEIDYSDEYFITADNIDKVQCDSRGIQSLRELERAIREPAKAAGIDCLSIKELDSEEIIGRLDLGEDIEILAPGGNTLTEVIRGEVKLLVSRVVQRGFVNGKDYNRLNEMLDLKQEGFLKALADDPVGRECLRAEKMADVNIFLGD